MEFIEYLRMTGGDGRSLRSKYEQKKFAEFKALLDAKGRETVAEGLINGVDGGCSDMDGGIENPPSIHVDGKQIDNLFGCTIEELEILSKMNKKVRVISRIEILD